MRTWQLWALALLLAGAWSHPSLAHPPLDRQDDPGDIAPAAAAQEKSEEDESWDVGKPQGPHHQVTFDTEQGTWMNLDVSPDGRTVIFDLLGDLYSVPLAGGDATRLTEGMAWDMQPRYSPDGTRILFTSDRGGTENVWIADADGSHAKALTKEKDKVTNCGAWSPDGQEIVVKRRLTDFSSIGTTELWMVHHTGGNGIQITKKDEIAEVSEPVFHPRGRFLYFSARPSRFSYDRNVHQGIYQIRRFDRLNGDVSIVTSRHGGAARPSISEDGRWLAFITRDVHDTVLMLHDLTSGLERELARGLDHDLQESFAWAGTYPAMDWTPDGKQIVFTMGGGLWRVDVASGEKTPIPFRAQVEQTVQDAVRATPDVVSDTFVARILRWIHTSPRDRSIVFSAVGRLYAADADGAHPRPLVDDGDEALEYCPRLSPDGKRLAYVSWSDRDKGQVWVARADGRGARRLTSLPGQYANPNWSPDGKQIVFLKGSGSTLRGEELGDELWHEIYVIDAQGGDPRYVASVGNRGSSARMPNPTFGPGGDRIYFMENGERDEIQFVSVTLEGIDKRIHAKLKFGEEFALSPDGRWLAYKHLHDAYVAPLPLVGRQALELGDSDGAVAVKKLTDGLADWITWADANTVTWAAGNTLHRQTLDALLAEKPEGEADSAAVVKPESIEVVLELKRHVPQGTLVLDGARLITMEGDEVVENGVIVVEGNRISALGPSGQVQIPAGAHVIDARGLTAIPGLVDAHAHMGYGGLDILPQRDWRYYANLAYGVTATMDPSASTHLVFSQAEMVEAGIMKGPRIYSTGFILYGADLSGKALTNSLDDARRHVKRMKKLGAFAVKSYMQPRREQRQWILAAAREESMLVFPEGGGKFHENLNMIVDGHTGIEHAIPVAPLHEDVVQLWSQTDVGYTPTLLVAYGGLGGENWFYQNEKPVFSNEKLLRFTPPQVIEGRARRLSVHAYDGDWHHLNVAASAKRLADAGVAVNMGAHGQLQGLGCHWELWALAQGGMAAHDVLRCGTIHPARYIGLGDQLGSLAAGKLADIVLLRENPLEDIRHTDSVRYVVKNGELFDADTMDQVYPAPVTRAPFLWQ